MTSAIDALVRAAEPELRGQDGSHDKPTKAGRRSLRLVASHAADAPAGAPGPDEISR